MEIGDVFVCPKFDDIDIVDKHKQKWWCIYMGESSLLVPPIFCYFHTTTTQMGHYRKGGNREHHQVMRISAGQWGFEQDCLIDFNNRPFTQPPEFFQDKKILIKGKIPEEGLRRVYDFILNSDSYIERIKHDIHCCLNNRGIYGLKKP